MFHAIGNQKKAGAACPSAAEWIRKIWYFHPMKSYSAIKKDNLEAPVGKGLQFEIMLIGEMV